MKGEQNTPPRSYLLDGLRDSGGTKTRVGHDDQHRTGTLRAFQRPLCAEGVGSTGRQATTLDALPRTSDMISVSSRDHQDAACSLASPLLTGGLSGGSSRQLEKAGDVYREITREWTTAAKAVSSCGPLGLDAGWR